MGKDNRRSIDTKFWTDPEVEQLSKNATYLFNSLLSFPENNMAGTFEISETKMSYYTKLDQSEINEAFKELESKNKVLRFKTWVSIKNHIKNQKLNGGMAIAVVKDLCDCPNPVKLWLFYQANSETLEPWFPKLLFNVNAYMNEQKKRYANRIKRDNPEITLIQALEEIKYKPLTEDQLLQIMVQNLPLDTKDLSNLSNMITLIEWLDNPSMNIKNKREIEYESEREYEKEDIKGKGNNKLISDNGTIKKPSFSPPPNFNKPNFQRDFTGEYEKLRIIWNALNLPECRKLHVNLSNWNEIMNSMNPYTPKEITAAVNNYSKLWQREKAITYSTFPNFLIRGIEKYADSSHPSDTFKKSVTEKKNSSDKISRYVPEKNLTEEEREKSKTLAGELNERFQA